MRNILDRVIGWVSPQAGIARHFARKNLVRAYEAANPRDSWRPRRSGASANADHQADAKVLRNKARSLVQNIPYCTAALNGLVSKTIGTGIIPRATGDEKEKLNKLFTEWAKVCDADGRFDYYGLQKAAYAAMEQDGEVLVRLRPRRLSDNLPVPLQLQLLEIDWLDSDRTGTADGGNQIINGIEYDALGAVAAYYLWDQHPGDTALIRGRKSQSSRVPAQNIIHLFDPHRPGQGRGFSRFASVIARVRDLMLYEDAELARKNLETRMSVLATGDTTGMQNPAAQGDDNSDREGTRDLGELGGGNIYGMPDGMKFTVVQPNAAPGYVEYVKYSLHLIATGLGVPYETLTGDMKEVNFSSARVRLLDFRDAVQQMQWLTLIPKLLRPIHEAFVEAAYLAGKIRERDMSVDFSPPKWDYVNPEQDVKADMAEISAGLSSVSEKLRQRGYDPEVVSAELAADINRWKDLGILDTLLFMQRGNLPTKPSGGDEPEASPA